MNADQWRCFGALLSEVHAAQLPSTVAHQLKTEDYRTPATAIGRDRHDRIRDPATSHLSRSADPLTAALICDWQNAGDAMNSWTRAGWRV